MAVNSYYAQFEQPASPAVEVVPEDAPKKLAEVVPEESEIAEPPQDGPAPAEAVGPSSAVSEEESPHDSTVPKKEFDTIKDSGEVS